MRIVCVSRGRHGEVVGRVDIRDPLLLHHVGHPLLRHGGVRGGGGPRLPPGHGARGRRTHRAAAGPRLVRQVPAHLAGHQGGHRELAVAVRRNLSDIINESMNQ